MKKIFVLFFLLVLMSGPVSGVPSPSTPELIDSQGAVLDSIFNGLRALKVGITNPASLSVVISSLTVSVFPVYATTSGNATAEVDINNRVKTNLSSITAPLVLSTGTNEIGEVGPDAASLGSGTTDATRPFATMLFGSDNSLPKRLFTAIVQTDGVNGNNILPGVIYGFNGTTFDRIPASASRGIKVDQAKIGPASTTIYTPVSAGNLVQVSVPSGARHCNLNATGTFESYLGSTTWTASHPALFYQVDFPVRGDGTDIVMVGQTATNTKIQADFVGE